MTVSACVALAAGFLSPSAPSFEIQKLGFLAGDWVHRQPSGEFQETWLSPAGGTMQGVGRHIQGEKTAFMEFFSIEPAPSGGLTLYLLLGALSKGDKKPKAFRLTTLEEGRAVFEMPENDFPTRIEYRLAAPGNLVCRLTGSSGGIEREVLFDFRAKNR
jgi:hypothetical protein